MYNNRLQPSEVAEIIMNCDEVEHEIDMQDWSTMNDEKQAEAFRAVLDVARFYKYDREIGDKNSREQLNEIMECLRGYVELFAKHEIDYANSQRSGVNIKEAA